MTFINTLIKQAKAEPKPAELTIRPAQVNAMSNHIMGCSRALLVDSETNRLFIQNQLLLGRIKLLDVPIRVVGK